ncbi:Uncharacterised protein [Serratia odorifera]|jgi:hypothetical protein|uniref:Uncharacterized protein n=3 Tax=Serratia odorifera TaxID=618 RepID=D4E0Y6_SEROD|nr:hypothetical protein HMPREF0758_2018 [Serratia odorifera DSM 4582]VDZ57521.1 Uncharacterised protein [Serratia odorifera]
MIARPALAGLEYLLMMLTSLKKMLLIFSLSVMPAIADAKGPDCWHWPASMAQVKLKNGQIKHADEIDSDNPRRVNKVLLSEQMVGLDPFYHQENYLQIYLFTFLDAAGKPIAQAITKSHSTYTECSMDEVTVYVVSAVLD